MKQENTDLTENGIFENIVFDSENPARGRYEECRFLRCGFANADLSGVTFRDCAFEGCDFSLAKLKNTSLQEVRFRECKLLGLQFGDCRTFLLELDFERCMLRLSTFFKLNLKNT
ncbi:pentapeptide repeat-containing protein, partial [Chlorobium limicola]|uniref:pentapeptide repeat-containing protein n=1 Tax=Chlorobium limicola TaxID=1092 RepID=UPI00137AA5EA